jgi:hypothetical protein
MCFLISVYSPKGDQRLAPGLPRVEAPGAGKLFRLQVEVQADLGVQLVVEPLAFAKGGEASR